MRSLLLVMVLVGSAAAAPAVDWAAGRVTAQGVGLADRQAPNPAVARGPARRKAEDAAKRALRDAVRTLPLSGGGTLADKLGDAAIAARVDRAVAAALPVTADLETDGSWTVTLAVPTEAIRQALAGPRALATEGDGDAPPVIVIEGAAATPAIGTMIGSVQNAIVWVKAVPEWAAKAPRVKARGVKAGAIDADVKTASPSTLFVVLVP